MKIRKGAKIERTKTILSQLIRHTIENGLITTLCALLNLVVFFVRKEDLSVVAV